MKKAEGGKEVVEIKKRRQPAFGLSKMRVLDDWTIFYTKKEKKEEK